jgi:hypothetical protein
VSLAGSITAQPTKVNTASNENNFFMAKAYMLLLMNLSMPSTAEMALELIS